MNFAILLCFSVSLQVFGTHSLTIELNTQNGNRRAFSIPTMARASTAPLPTVPMARQTLSTNVNVPSVSASGATDTNIAAVFPSTQTTVGVAGIEVLRRATELVADRIVSALGGVATLIDIIRNTSTNGDVAWSNLGTTSQILTDRFLRVGMNTANTLLQELSNQLSVSGNPSTVLQGFINFPNFERFAIPQGTIGSILRSTPLANGGQTVFSNGVFSAVPNSATANVTPMVGESTVSDLATNVNGTNDLPSVTTISTSRPGLNIPDATSATISNDQPGSIVSEVETFLENVPNLGNVEAIP